MIDTITKQEPKLSVRKPGYWRNKYFSDVWIGAAPGEYIAPGKWPTAEIAEQKSVEKLSSVNPERIARWKSEWRFAYLGPVFFPEGDDQ